MNTVENTAENTVENLRARARELYSVRRARGDGAREAIQSVWMTLRPKHLRAPDAFEQINRNGSSVRDYRSPIGLLLEIPGAVTEYGRYGNQWRRTQRSYREAAEVEAAVVAFFEGGCR